MKLVFSEYYRQKSTESAVGDTDLEHEPRLDFRVGGFAEFKRRMKSLFTNGVYVFIVLAGVADAIVASGFILFGAKYFEQQFQLRASTSAIIFG